MPTQTEKVDAVEYLCNSIKTAVVRGYSDIAKTAYKSLGDVINSRIIDSPVNQSESDINALDSRIWAAVDDSSFKELVKHTTEKRLTPSEVNRLVEILVHCYTYDRVERGVIIYAENYRKLDVAVIIRNTLGTTLRSGKLCADQLERLLDLEI